MEYNGLLNLYSRRERERDGVKEKEVNIKLPLTSSALIGCIYIQHKVTNVWERFNKSLTVLVSLMWV